MFKKGGKKKGAPPVPMKNDANGNKDVAKAGNNALTAGNSAPRLGTNASTTGNSAPKRLNLAKKGVKNAPTVDNVPKRVNFDPKGVQKHPVDDHHRKKRKGCCKLRKPHPGCFCRCWYPCLWFLLFIIAGGLTFLGYEIYVVLRYYGEIRENVKEDKHKSWMESIILISIIASILFLIYANVGYLLVYYEAKGRKAIILFAAVFTVTVIAAFVVIILTFICDTYCITTDVILDPRILNSDPLITITQTFRVLAILRFVLIIFLLHIFIFYIYKFRQEEHQKNDPECNQGNPNRAQVHPSTPTESRSHSSSHHIKVFKDPNANNPKIQVIYFQL